MKITEDPWDNFLYYDSKFLLPLICHNQALAIEEQLLVAKFILHTVSEETISQYKVQGETLAQEFIKFVKDESDGDEVDIDEDESETGQDLLRRIKGACDGHQDE
jgi:hypothetical protein